MDANKNDVDISGLDPAEILAALYTEAGSLGLGAIWMFSEIIAEGPPDMSHIEATNILASSKVQGGAYVDYVNGRRMKLFFRDDGHNRLDVFEYDQCANRPASEVIAKLRASKENRTA